VTHGTPAVGARVPCWGGLEGGQISFQGPNDCCLEGSIP
jgi:hypothetical protein